MGLLVYRFSCVYIGSIFTTSDVRRNVSGGICLSVCVSVCNTIGLKNLYFSPRFFALFFTQQFNIVQSEKHHNISDILTKNLQTTV